MFLRYLLYCVLLYLVNGFCGESIKWLHQFNMEDVYGIWFGVGYAQHTPDMTNKPTEVGCVTLYISDATTQGRDDWLGWSLISYKNYSDQTWKSKRSNLWSDTAMSGSWLDVRIKRRVKRDVYTDRRLKILWDEDGQTMEQVYDYYTEDPGLWYTRKRRPGEQEMLDRGVDLWYPDDPPRHPEVIRILKVTPHLMILTHCSETGVGGIFTLILRRSPSKVQQSEWFSYQRLFYNFNLPPPRRHFTICAGCVDYSSVIFVLFCVSVSQLLYF